MTDGWDLSGEMFSLIDSLSQLRALAARDIRADGEIPLVREALGLLLTQHGLEQCSVFMNFDDRLCCIAGRGAAGDPAASTRAPLDSGFRSGIGLMGHAVSSARLQHAPDLSEDTRYVRRNDEASGSLICAPMVSQRRVLGVVNAYSETAWHFQPWHEGVFMLFASALAHILDNNRVLRRLADARATSSRVA